MALLRMKDVIAMSEKDRKEKLAQLKLELVKAGVVANRTNAKTKEIKRAISRILTVKVNPINKSVKEALKHK